MKTQEVVQRVTKIMNAKNIAANQKTTREFLDSLEEVVDNAILKGDSVVLFGVKLSTKEQKGREGTIHLGNRKGEAYTSPDKIVPVAKYMKSKKDKLTKEV
ncbi:MAG: HU family DNA-binding protein [Clostridium sp.]|uniref:HU family DNA-binding protein n=1 Tax=Clostridium sp. TaxID=1506 RepID=UPI003EE7CC16